VTSEHWKISYSWTSGDASHSLELVLTAITLPGGGKLGVYQPHHPRPGPVDGR
jgi:hypothetical protein